MNAPSNIARVVEEPRFWFSNGNIWSAMGGCGEHTLEPVSAEEQLLALRAVTTCAGEPGYWRFACKRYARQLDTALEQYRAFQPSEQRQ